MAYDFEKWVANDMLRKVTRRRWLPYFLGLMIVVMAAVGVLEAFDDGTDAERFPNMITFALPFILASLGSPFARDAWLGPRMDKVFDEFERDALARATTRAYSVFLSLLITLFIWFWFASVNGWPLPRTPLDWSTLGFAVMGIGAALPIFFTEIMVPLPPAGEMQED